MVLCNIPLEYICIYMEIQYHFQITLIHCMMYDTIKYINICIHNIPFKSV